MLVVCCVLNRIRCLLFVTCCSSRVVYSPCVACVLLVVDCCVLLVAFWLVGVRWVLGVACCSMFNVRCSLLVMRWSLFVVRCSLFVVRCWLLVVYCFVVCCVWCVVC